MKFRLPIKWKNKTYKQPYSGSKRFDGSCHNNRSCDYCRDSRLYRRNVIEEAMEAEIRDYELGVDEELAEERENWQSFPVNNSDGADELEQIEQELSSLEEENGKTSGEFYEGWMSGREPDTFENNCWAMLYEATLIWSEDD